MKLSTFITRHQITLSSTPTTHNPHFPGEEGAAMSHWRCTLRCGGRSMTTPYSVGDRRLPTVGELLDHLAKVARDLSTPEGWADSWGLDPAAPQTLGFYAAARLESAALERLLGASDYRFLLDRVESSKSPQSDTKETTMSNDSTLYVAHALDRAGLRLASSPIVPTRAAAVEAALARAPQARVIRSGRGKAGGSDIQFHDVLGGRVF